MRITALVLLLFSSALAFGQDCPCTSCCSTCYSDLAKCTGYAGSFPCDSSTKCVVAGPQKSAYLDSKTPGMLAEQRGGKLLVRSVIHGSPAQFAGVQVGDEILSINGKTPHAGCFAQWSKGEQTAIVVLARGRKTVRVQVAVVPLRSLLVSRSPLLRASGGAKAPFEVDAPFTFGFRWREAPGYLEVSEVLAGSPAEAAGLQVGDEIVYAGSTSPSQSGITIDPSSLRDGDSPRQVTLEIAEGTARKQVTLWSRGISQVVRSPNRRAPLPRIKQPSVAAALQ